MVVMLMDTKKADHPRLTISGYLEALDRKYSKLVRINCFLAHLITIIKQDRWAQFEIDVKREELPISLIEGFDALNEGMTYEVNAIQNKLNKLEELLREKIPEPKACKSE